VVCASVCWRTNSVIDTRSVSLLLSQSRNVRVGGSSRFPATLSYDLPRQPTVPCDLVRSVGALSTIRKDIAPLGEIAFRDETWIKRPQPHSFIAGVKAWTSRTAAIVF
jgi:hypothetical protein